MPEVNIDAATLIIKKIKNWGESVIENIPNFIIAIIVVVLFWALSKFAYRLAKKMFQKTHLNEGLENLLANVLKISVALVGIVFALGVLKLDKVVFSMLAGVGVAGLALGFAFRDLASNFISGIMLATSAPFRIGDVIQIGSLQGSVAEIRLRDTLIKNFSGQDILVPNKEFMTSQIQNYSTNGKRKIVINFGVDYSDNLEDVSKEITQKLIKIDGLLESEGVSVNYSGFGDSAINIETLFWIKYPGSSYADIKNKAMLEIKRIIDDGKFNVPYPIQTLKIENPTNKES